jgi:tetratricopeptide (TPR) repeat protein
MTLGIASLFIFGLLFKKALILTNDILDKPVKVDSTKTVSAETLQISGDAHFALENYSAAFADYSESLKITPNATAYIGLGNVFVKMNNISEGINNYTKAIELKPDCADYYFIRGKTYNLAGKYSEALNDFDKALALEPNNVEFKQNKEFTLVLIKSQ